jgi:hypothetical protein
MARYFEINHATPTVKLDSQGRGTAQYTVKNVSAAPTDVRAVLVSLPPLNPPGGVVQNGWVKIEPPTDRLFDKDKTETFIVKIEITQKDRSKAGTYSFRLDAVTVAIPDRGDEGPAVSFTLAPGEVKPTNRLAWLIPVIVVLFLAIGIGAWLALRKTGPNVPDLTGKSTKDAVTLLAAAKLTLDPHVDTVAGKAEDAGKVVSQTPASGSKAKEGDAVHVTMGGVPKVPGPAGESGGPKVPDLTDKNDLVSKGEAIASLDPLAKLLSDQPGHSSVGFLTGLGAAENQTLPGPGKDQIRDALALADRASFQQAVEYSLDKNNNTDLAAKGAHVVEIDPAVKGARSQLPLSEWLGFKIATGLFGPAADGALGHTAEGPGSNAIRDHLSPDGQKGFRSAVKFFLP